MSRAVANHFREQNSGAFVHMTSTSGLIGNFGQANYMAAKLGIEGLSRGIALDMARYKVRSNCIAPFAWTRMIDSIPADTPEGQARAARTRLAQMTAEKIAPMAVYLASDKADGISGQIIGVRKNEMILFNQPRPIRIIHRSDGWTPRNDRQAVQGRAGDLVRAARTLAERLSLGSRVMAIVYEKLLALKIPEVGASLYARRCDLLCARPRPRAGPDERGRVALRLRENPEGPADVSVRRRASGLLGARSRIAASTGSRACMASIGWNCTSRSRRKVRWSDTRAFSMWSTRARARAR